MSQDYFSLFGLEPGFRVDNVRLTENFRRLQQAVHPDRFASASAQQQRLALTRTAEINDAYAVLRDPLKRAQYLLSTLRGLATDNQSTVSDPEFLMEQMDLREKLSDLDEQADAKSLSRFSEEIATRLQDKEDQLADAFADPEDRLTDIQKLILHLQFLQKLQFEIEQKEDKLYQ